PLDRRSDIFALAVVMYEMLAIKRLFHRDSDFLTFKAITEEPIPDILERRPDLPFGMRAALVQAMARDPNGRFDTMQAFGNAIRNSVATLGGPATPEDLARLLSADFGDEMSARDEILKAADDVKSAPGIKLPPIPPPTPPPRPNRPTPPPPLPGVSGEVPTILRTKEDSGLIQAVPSTIVQPGSSKMSVPPGVIDLSSAVQPDSWMVDPDTDLLRGHRVKSVVRTLLGVAVIGAIVGVAILAVKFAGGSDDDAKPLTAPAVTISVDAPVPPAKPSRAAFDDLDGKIAKGAQWAEATVVSEAKLGPAMAKRADSDWWWSSVENGRCYLFGLVKEAGESTVRNVITPATTIPLRECQIVASGAPPSDEISREDIVALSKFGFLSLTATATTTVYVDNTRIGDTPLRRLPLSPGPHTVKAMGPKGKVKTMKITIYGGRDTDEGTINWN
ncbi:MAG TPA: hypothetical protein VGO00_28385, partial [Kofleriaceae bacterium]|nr:hypothetical protein [Kofleriaceae bacterium]